MVLRIRQNTYYRIELPSHTFEENKKVDQLKTVLASVLQYETTSCPFKRGFTVDLPEPPKTPIQKRPWRPKPGPTGSPPEVSEDFNRKAVFMNNRLSRSPCSNEIDTAENLVFQEGEIRNHSTPAPSDVSSLESMDDEGSKATDDIGFIRKDLPGNVYDERDDSKTPTRPKSLRAGRAVTAPPQLTLSTASPLNSATDAQTIPKQQRESSSLASSVDSFHSFHSPISPLSSSPPFPTSSKPHATIVAPRIRSHKRDVSDITVTAGSPELWDFSDGRSSDESSYHSPPDLPATPPLVRDTASPDDNQWPEAITPPPPTVLRRRPETRQRRNQSPLPPSSNLYSPYSPRSQMSGHHLTTAILQRTCSLLLGPPVQLVALMMRIAAKIARGAFRGTSFGFGEGGQKIPCSWDFSDGDEADDLWEEDDFGVALGNPGSSRGSGAKEVGGSWEID